MYVSWSLPRSARLPRSREQFSRYRRHREASFCSSPRGAIRSANGFNSARSGFGAFVRRSPRSESLPVHHVHLECIAVVLMGVGRVASKTISISSPGTRIDSHRRAHRKVIRVSQNADHQVGAAVPGTDDSDLGTRRADAAHDVASVSVPTGEVHGRPSTASIRRPRRRAATPTLRSVHALCARFATAPPDEATH